MLLDYSSAVYDLCHQFVFCVCIMLQFNLINLQYVEMSIVNRIYSFYIYCNISDMFTTKVTLSYLNLTDIHISKSKNKHHI